MIVVLQGINLQLSMESEVLYARRLRNSILIRTSNQMEEAFDRIYRQFEDDNESERVAGRLGLSWFPIFQGVNGFSLPYEVRVTPGEYLLKQGLTWARLDPISN